MADEWGALEHYLRSRVPTAPRVELDDVEPVALVAVPEVVPTEVLGARRSRVDRHDAG